MTSEAQELLRYFRGEALTNPIGTKVTESAVTAARLSSIFLEATRGLPRDILGYVACPTILPFLVKSPDLVREMLKAIRTKDVSHDQGVVLLDFIDSSIRRATGRQYRGEYFDELESIAASKSQDADVRAKALRLMARDTSTKAEAVFYAVANEGDLVLVDNIAAALRTWVKLRRPPSRRLVKALDKFARSKPHIAIQSASLIAILSGQNGTASTLEKLASVVQKDTERARFISAIRDSKYKNIANRIALDILKEPSPLSALVLKTVLDKSVRLRRAIKTSEHFPSFLTRFSNASPDVPSLAGSEWKRQATQRKRLARTLAESSVVRGRGILATSPGFSVDFHVGDSLYRDLLIPWPIEHWHTGLYQGMSITNGSECTLQGVHASGNGLGDCIIFFTASKSFVDPSTDVPGTMRALWEDFIVAFAEGRKGHPYHRSRRIVGMTHAQRFHIARTGTMLFGRGISWTWVDMLDYKGWDWDGGEDDIDETRCDGVIEYCYERNGLRVCSGKNGELWNISNRGTKHPENHNSDHEGTYDKGELCPRLQAGDTGDTWHQGAKDSAFIFDFSVVPEISNLEIFPFVGIHSPSIHIKVKSDSYNWVYLRITVSRDGGPVYFLKSLKVYGRSAPVGIAGDWLFYSVSANTPDPQLIWWLGTTVNGPHFGGHDGVYKFSVTAVDPAGNVSLVHSVKLSIVWPSIQITCINKKDRRDEYSRIQAIGGEIDGEGPWKLMLGEAILMVENHVTFYVERPAGHRTGVEVATSKKGWKYLKTVDDYQKPNNLLELPECT